MNRVARAHPQPHEHLAQLNRGGADAEEYQGGSAQRMVEANLAMFDITVSEHPELRIPYLGFRGVPIGIDIHRVVDTGITPILDIGIAGKAGGQIGAGSFRAPLECFQLAVAAYGEAYGD